MEYEREVGGSIPTAHNAQLKNPEVILKLLQNNTFLILNIAFVCVFIGCDCSHTYVFSRRN